MNRTISDIAHGFFYSTKDEEMSTYSGSFSYLRGVAYSYYTEVARRMTGKDGREVVFISSESMSSTTSKHIQKLRYANPNAPSRTISFPYEYGRSAYSEKGFLERLLKVLSMYTGNDGLQHLRFKDNRYEFKILYESLLKFNELVLTVPKRELNKYAKVMESCREIEEHRCESLKKLMTASREKAKKKAAETKKKIDTYCKKHHIEGLLSRICVAFSSSCQGKDTEVVPADVRIAVRESLYKDFTKDADRRPSFVFPDKGLDVSAFYCGDRKIEECVRTSQNIRMTVDKVKKLLVLWKAGRLHKGMEADKYTVISATADHVQIGCHLIPTENVQALYEYYIGNKPY